MNNEMIPLSGRAGALRQAFDQTFAAAPGETTVTMQAFLAIGVGGDNYALRLSEIAELFADKKVVPLPSQSTDVLGIASFRGVLVAIYDLRSLLGYPNFAGASPRWLALVAPDAPVGLAFDQLDGYLDLPPEAIAQASEAERARQHLTETVSAAGVVRPVISVASILTMIERRAQAASPHQRD
ncbi:MAG: chemotaxis protein CheW [Anaerolineae bacterium]